MDAYRFEVVEGERFIIRMRSGDTFVDPEIKVFDPDGNKVEIAQFDILDQEFMTGTKTGTYYLIAQERDGNGTGNYGLSIQFLREDCSMNLECGANISGTISQLAEMDAYVFSLASGSSFEISLSGEGGLYPEVTVYAPDGVSWTDWDYSSASIPETLTQKSGNYYIIVDPAVQNKSDKFKRQLMVHEIAHLIAFDLDSANTTHYGIYEEICHDLQQLAEVPGRHTCKPFATPPPYPWRDLRRE